METRDRIYRKIIEFGLIGLIVFSPLPAASVHEWSLLVIQVTAIVLMIFYLLARELLGQRAHSASTPKWPKYLFVGFWGVVVLQTLPLPKFITSFLSPKTVAFQKLYSPDFSSIKFLSISLVPAHTLKTALALLSYFLIGFLIVKTVNRRSQFQRLFLAVFFMGIFEASYALIQRHNSGTFVSRNHFAGYLEMIVPIGIGLIFSQANFSSFFRLSWKEKIIRLSDKRVAVSLLLLFGVILMSLALVFSRSRSAAILLVIIFFLFFLLAVWRKGQDKELKKGIIGILIFVFIVILSLSLYFGMGATFQRFSLDNLLHESRPDIWAGTLKIFSGFPVFGTGLGTFEALYPNVEGDGELAKISHAHNDYLEYLAETGVIGGGLLWGGIFVILFKCFGFWKKRRYPAALGLGMGGMVSMAAILIHSLTDFNLHIPANMLLFTVILSLTTVTVTYKPSKK